MTKVFTIHHEHGGNIAVCSNMKRSYEKFIEHGKKGVIGFVVGVHPNNKIVNKKATYSLICKQIKRIGRVDIECSNGWMTIERFFLNQ